MSFMLADQHVIFEDSSICLKSPQFFKADCWSSLIFFVSNTLTITKRRTWQETLPSPFLVIFVRFLCCRGSYIVYIHFTLTVFKDWFPYDPRRSQMITASQKLFTCSIVNDRKSLFPYDRKESRMIAKESDTFYLHSSWSEELAKYHDQLLWYTFGSHDRKTLVSMWFHHGKWS